MATARTTTNSGQKNNQKLGELENLVDELIKDAPSEERIRFCMEAVGLKYTHDPIGRMSDVLSALDGIRANRRNQMKEQA
jgi:hypothetical protein